MSYMKDLDEYTDAQLIAELNRREQLRNDGRCPYCQQDALTSAACRQTEQHARAKALAELRTKRNG